jgi:hypothetical protein
MDATRAEEPQVEETSMEISTVENLKHILEMELCADAEDDLEGIYSDDGLDWWPAEKVRQGDLKELQGLFDKGVLRPAREEARSDGKRPRYISSKIVRKTKGENVKTRMCLRDFNHGRPEGGELFAATPSLMALKMLLTIASWSSMEIRDLICLIGDVTQAFVHAPIDEWIQTRVPESLGGLEIRVDNEILTLYPGMLLDVMKALYGYRKSPRLWQDWISERLTQLPLSRSKVEPTIYFNKEKQVMLAMHVDDLMFLGPKENVEAFFAQLQKEVLIREVGRLENPDDEVTYHGKTITRTRRGFELRASDKLIESYIRVWRGREQGSRHAHCEVHSDPGGAGGAT